jgi:hypothetical protein
MPAQPARSSLTEYGQGLSATRMATDGKTLTAVDPELLRWRAEVLLDEMMLGGADLPQNGLNVAAKSSGASLPLPVFPLEREEKTQHGVASDSMYDNGQDGLATKPFAVSNTTDSQSKISPPSRLSPQLSTPERTSPGSIYSVNSNTQIVASPGEEGQKWLFAAEDRYRPRTDEAQVASKRSSEPVEAQPIFANYLWPETNPRSATQGNGGATRSEPTLTTAESGRRISTQFTEALAATNPATRRSNLLPRVSAADVDALQREIHLLQNEVDHILPVGHESNRRARHWLEKAQSILQTDTMRSAEVEYYLQQVRTIFQRVQQTMAWSNVYRKRLLTYLVAWSILSILVVVAYFLYQGQSGHYVMLLTSLRESHPVTQQASSLFVAFFAGALGGSLGALVNLGLQNARTSGFIDRKFGLRGLILPLMGAIVGLFIYLPIGLLYFVFHLNPTQALWLGCIPALLAFVYGIGQESLYGTRN